MPQVRRKGRKHLSKNSVLGQRGINLIERNVLDMGCRWTASGPNEVGIDGYIELFDPSSRAPLGKTVAVQSKAFPRLPNESETHFDYWCDRRDLDYWLHSNLPMALIVSRPDTEEAYWIPIKDYFADSGSRNSPKIRFDKNCNRLSAESLSQLIDLGRAPEEGLFLAPVPRKENLYCNLLPLLQTPSLIYAAQTELRQAFDVRTKLRAQGKPPGSSWTLKNKMLLSFHNLEEHPWQEVCDPGTVESFATAEWAESNDPSRQREFVELLNRALRSDLGPGVRYWPHEDCYAISGYDTKKLSYHSAKRNSKITVISSTRQTSAAGTIFTFLRHLAFRGQFRPFGRKWYLEVTPTYRLRGNGGLFGHRQLHLDPAE